MVCQYGVIYGSCSAPARWQATSLRVLLLAKMNHMRSTMASNELITMIEQPLVGRMRSTVWSGIVGVLGVLRDVLGVFILG